MSLQRMKTLFCIVVMALAVILVARAGGIGEIAAIILLTGALPGWTFAEKAMLARAFEQAATFLEVLQHADEASQPPDQVLQASPAQKQRARQG